MLSCNAVVQIRGFGETEVAAIDPASMQAIENRELATAAAKVRAKLQRVVDGVSQARWSQRPCNSIMQFYISNI